MSWEEVSAKLEASLVYWLATTRPDGRPHLGPRDGIWLGDRLYYGGSPATVHQRNLETNPSITALIGEGQEAVIVEGVSTKQILGDEVADLLATASSSKYPQYGTADPSAYKAGDGSSTPAR